MGQPGYVDGEFEVEFPPFLSGTMGVRVAEVGELPSRIIDINDDVDIDVDWSLTGPLQRFICGSWDLDIYVESIGPGPEFELADVENIQVDPTGNGHYHHTIHVPAGTIPTHLEQNGKVDNDVVYKMVATVTYKDPAGRPGPIAGFTELPLMHFYKAE